MKILKLVPLLSLLAVQTHAASKCGDAAFEVQAIQNATSSAADPAWRRSATNFEKGVTVQTSASREASIKAAVKEMSEEILGQGAYVNKGDTPPFEFHAQDGVVAKIPFQSRGMHQGYTTILIGGLGPKGIVTGTVLAPVSGHTGAANAKAWSKTDTYTVRMDVSKDTQGKQFTDTYGDRAPQVLIQDAKSLDVVTSHEVQIQLVSGKTVRLYYFRSGSGGPGGYDDGRIINLVWDGT